MKKGIKNNNSIRMKTLDEQIEFVQNNISEVIKMLIYVEDKNYWEKQRLNYEAILESLHRLKDLEK